MPLAALEASFARGRIVHDGLTLAIVGRPNAGKSSLFNRLVERDRAIVTATPGTTRDLVTERISLDGIPLELVDTAGLRDTAEEVEQLGIARSREALADAALVLVVLDATQPMNEEERRLLSAIEERPALIAINKCDLGPATRKVCLLATAIEIPRHTYLGIDRRRNQRTAGTNCGPGYRWRSFRTGHADKHASSPGDRHGARRPGCGPRPTSAGSPTR